MASKPYVAAVADFDERYARWVAAQESGDQAEIKAAAADLPTLNARVRAKLAAVDETVTDPEDRAVERRLIVMLSEIHAQDAARRRKRKEAAKRRQERTIRLSRTVELPTKCARCGNKLDGPKTTGRPRVYCSPACRKAAYEDRRAHREDAVQVQVVEKVVTEIRERRIEVPHPRSDCVRSVLADEDAMLRVLWTLTALVRDRSRSAYNPDQPRFQQLRRQVDTLQEAITRRGEE